MLAQSDWEKGPPSLYSSNYNLLSHRNNFRQSISRLIQSRVQIMKEEGNGKDRNPFPTGIRIENSVRESVVFAGALLMRRFEAKVDAAELEPVHRTVAGFDEPKPGSKTAARYCGRGTCITPAHSGG
jgi:hypothetical protein